MSEITFKAPTRDSLWRRFLDALPPPLVCGLSALVAFVIPALLMRYPMITVIVGVVGLLGMVLVISSPYVGLLIFLGLLYLRPEEIFPVLTGARFTLLVSLVALFGWAVNTCLSRGRIHVHTPVLGCLVGFVTVAIGSTVVSGTGMLTEIVLDTLKLFILFVLIVHLVDTERRLSIASGAILLFSVLLGARTIWQYQNGQALLAEGQLRALGTGIFGDPNDLALAMAMALPLALGGALRKGGGWWRLWSLVAVVILGWTIYVTNSRGGMLAMAACVFLFFRRQLGHYGLVLGAVAVLGLFAFGPSRLSQMSADEESAHGRVNAWHAGMDMLTSSPVWGVGRDQFTEHYHKTAHNSLVLCLAELGLAGTALWLGLFYFTLRDGQRAMRYQSCGAQMLPGETVPAEPAPVPASRAAMSRRCYSALLQISLATFLVGGFFLSRTYTPPLYVYLALAVSAAQVESGGRKSEANGRDWATIAALTLAGLLLVIVCVRLWS